MKTLKISLLLFLLILFYTTTSSPTYIESNVIIDDDCQPAVSGLYLTSNYANDAACIQAALDNAKSGDTITIREGDYYITKKIYQKDKNLNIIGQGKVTFYLKTEEGYKNGLYFSGSIITNKPLSVNAQKGLSQIVLTDASQIRQNDLIKIWNNAKWCPLDYPDQMTGEMYVVKSVNGNIITLNEQLLRDYKLSENSQVEIYRPIQINIENIRIQDSGSTTCHEGLALKYCKDSSVINSWFKDSGFAAVSLYSCFNVNVTNNEIYNSILSGSGYGVGVWSASAFIDIDNNYIENCRHAITGNTDERKALNRNVKILNNIITGANISDSHAIDAHPVTIDYMVTNNKIYLNPEFFAFADGTLKSVFSDNEVYGGYGAVARRGNLNNGVHLIKDNYIEESNGYTYEGLGNGVGNTLEIVNNRQYGGKYGVAFPYSESFKNIIIAGNTFSNISNQGIYQKFHINGVNLKICNNTFKKINRDGVYIDGNSFTNGEVKIQNNIFVNVYPSKPGSEITIKNIQNPLINKNKI